MSDSKLWLPQAPPEGAFCSSSPEPLLFNFLQTILYMSEESTWLSAVRFMFQGQYPNYCRASWKSRASWECLNHRFICWFNDQSSSCRLVFVSDWICVGLNLVALFCSMKRQLILGMNQAGHGPSQLWWWIATNFLTNSWNKEPLGDAQHPHDAFRNLSCHVFLSDSQFVVL